MNRSLTSTPFPEARSLRWKLRGVAVRQYVVGALAGAGAGFAAALGWLLVEGVLDNGLELPWVVRVLFLLGGSGGAGWAFWRVAQFSRWRGETELALLVERAVPEFRGRLVSAIQLSREVPIGVSMALIRALLAETVSIASRVDFRAVVKLEKAKRIWLAAVGVLLACLLVFFVAGISRSSLLIRRALLSNEALPRQTRILAVTGDRKIAAGERIVIEVLAEGVLPREGHLLVKTDAGAKREFSLEADPKKASRFVREIAAVQESFRYSVKVNDATSAEYHVTVLARPAVTRIECEQRYPAYTHLPPAKRAVEDLRLLAGSVLLVKMKANTAIRSGFVKLEGTGTELPVRVESREIVSVQIPIPAKGSTGFSVHLVDGNGLSSDDTVVHRFEVIADRPPEIKLSAPEEHDQTVTLQASVPIHYEAKDDFGIDRLALHYGVKPSGGDGILDERTVPLPQNGVVRQVDGTFEWHMGEITPPLPLRSVVEFWLEAADNNNVTGPGVGRTERYRFKLVTPEEKRAELVNRLEGTFRILNGVTSDQEKLNKDIRKVMEGSNQ